MLIVCPYTSAGLRAETWSRLGELAQQGYDVRPILLRQEDAYWQLLSQLWSGGEDFCLIEHDIVPHAGVLPAFVDCPEPWCTFAYPYDRFGLYHGSGCARFRHALMRLEPDLLERVAETNGGELHPPKHWCTLDAFIQMHLGARGYAQHRHEPPVTHLSPGCSHGCVPA